MKAMVSTSFPQQPSMGSGQPTSMPKRLRPLLASTAFCPSLLKSTSSLDARRHSLIKSVVSGASGWCFAARSAMNS
eukprot:CAMPEP_0204084254 /NCGR_PEP_ID=MMETSP0360-20130528/179834_1 /ASSEMBLY_ACC=CAM_ASM_000342 /TAXON_ID=268821 /ORGANISM="Scrippsiella Hangoei, Strain SHTV-5" /LENGTH=75 /DNA_ID=CAMNT_0051033241 /DNA_START=9 /DNA_END=232 /DNA_ORIENTATION=+